MTLPAGIERREIAGEPRLATAGAPVYGEPTAGEWRAWDTARSKVGAMIDRGLDTGIEPGAGVLYLGAATGTTASHLADVTRPVYAVEFAGRPMRDLVRVAEDRPGLVPLLKDARRPGTYAHVVEADLDVVVQDVATRDQAAVALANERFLADDGRLVLAVKARSADVTADPAATFDAVLDRLDEAYEVLAAERLDPRHLDHLGVIARPRR